MNDDFGFRVFKRAAWLSMPLVARMSAWPILLVVLPIIWELVKAFMASRVSTIHGSPDEIATSLRGLATALPPESWARRNWVQAEMDVAGGRG